MSCAIQRFTNKNRRSSRIRWRRPRQVSCGHEFDSSGFRYEDGRVKGQFSTAQEIQQIQRVSGRPECGRCNPGKSSINRSVRGGGDVAAGRLVRVAGIARPQHVYLRNIGLDAEHAYLDDGRRGACRVRPFRLGRALTGQQSG